MIKRDEIDWTTVQIDGIDLADYPDFCDAFACYAETVEGRELTDAELEYLNDHYRDDLADAIENAGVDATCAIADLHDHYDL